jgi:hypothetical protein
MRMDFSPQRIALINERKDVLIKHYPQLEKIYFIMASRPAELQYLTFVNALAVMENLEQRHFDGIVTIADLHGKHIAAPVLKCRFMRDTGKQANHKRPCMGNWIECKNPECPMDEYFSGYCKPEKCNFFEAQTAN